VDFELAKRVFQDPLALERVDNRQDYGEDRIRLISARRATKSEEDDYVRRNA
jgi:uncharacterized DUF497 family protein